MTLDQNIAAFVLGELLSSELPRAATEALEEGHDSSDLAALAGATSDASSARELEELWLRGIRQAGKSLPDRATAGQTLRDHYASLVSSGSLAPRPGAALIVRLAGDLYDVFPDRIYAGDGLGVAKLLGLYYAYDDVQPDDEKAFHELDAEIVAECRRLARERAV